MAQTDPVESRLEPMFAEALQRLSARWGWFVALGVALAALGVLATVYVLAATVVSVLFVGAFMVAGGIAQLIHAWKLSGWRSFMWWTLSGVLYCVAGGLVLYSPGTGAAVLTLFLGAALIAVGALRLWIWFQHRAQQGWQWLAISGLISLAAGVLIAAGWPANSVWILGFLLALDLLFQGWMLILLGFALRRYRE